MSVMEIGQRCKFHRAEDGTGYARLPNGDLCVIGDAKFKRYLYGTFFREKRVAASPSLVKTAVHTLQAIASEEGSLIRPAIRVAGDLKASYLDLCDDLNRVVLITGSGWHVLDNQDVPFLRKPGMLAIPLPDKAGNLDGLWEVINCQPKDRVLIAGALLGMLHPTGPYFTTYLHGEHGTAKSSTTRILRGLIDPNKAPTVRKPKSEEDLFLAANAQHVLTLENVSKLSSERSDVLCAIATRTGSRKRRIHTSEEESIIEVCKPVIINGIGNAVTRGDLVSRTISVELPRMKVKKTEAAINRIVEREGRAILGALLNAASLAMEKMDEVAQEYEGQFERMADAACWITAGEEALGFKRGSFLKRLKEMLAEGDEELLGGSGLAAAIVAEMRERGDVWEASATVMTQVLRRREPSISKKANTLTGELMRIAPQMEAHVGIRITKGREHAGRFISIRRLPEPEATTEKGRQDDPDLSVAA